LLSEFTIKSINFISKLQINKRFLIFLIEFSHWQYLENIIVLINPDLINITILIILLDISLTLFIMRSIEIIYLSDLDISRCLLLSMTDTFFLETGSLLERHSKSVISTFIIYINQFTIIIHILLIQILVVIIKTLHFFLLIIRLLMKIILITYNIITSLNIIIEISRYFRNVRMILISTSFFLFFLLLTKVSGIILIIDLSFGWLLFSGIILLTVL